MNQERNNSIPSIIKKIDRQSITAFVAALALVIYSLTIKDDYDRITTREITGELKYTPYIKETGGDFTYYHLFMEIEGSDDIFVARDCAFAALEKSQLDLLEKGKKITLTINTSRKKESYPYNVLGLEYKKNKLIDTKYSIACLKAGWKKSSILLLISAVIIIVNIIRVYKK